MRFRKPHPIPLLFIIAATVTLIGLGIWQVNRLSWKNQLVADIAVAQQEPALGTLPQDTQGLQYRKVMLTGKFQFDKAMHLIGPQQGPQVGYYLDTPFVLEDDGRVILVNRGFSPANQESKPEGTVTVEGIIRPARAKAFFAPKNQPDKNVWFYEDIDAMSAHAGVTLLPVVVEAVGAYEKDTFPIPGKGIVNLRNDHLGYAITWFSVALAGLVMFGFYIREPKDKA